MLFIASVMGNCPVVLFDEPTSGLDPESRRLLWNVMLALFQDAPAAAGPDIVNIDVARRTRSCVLTTHSLEEAEALCSRVAIMLAGKIFAIGFLIFNS